MVFHEDWTNFSELQADLAAGRQDRLIYYAFDLLWHNGDVRKLPQIKRKQALLDFLGANGVEMPVLYSESHRGRSGDVRARRQIELGRHCLEAGERFISIGADRSLAEN